jgi:carboxyl-terminal processing protease
MRTVIKGFVAVSVVAAGFLGGFTADTLREAPHNLSAARWKLGTVPPAQLANLLRPAVAQAQNDELDPPDTYQAVLNTVRAQYYPGTTTDRDKLGVTKLTYAAIDGMLASLKDPYTVFYTPKEYKDMLQEQSGNPFVGIGARLDLTKDKRVIVIEPIDGSPAARAGVQAGDIITAVDGKAVFGKKLDDVIDHIRGEEGTFVRLTVERKGKPVQFSLKRAMVNSPVVDSWMEDDASKIGYIRLLMFNEQADQQFDRALAKLEKQGMRALVFDLRDNPGGLLNIAQDIASRFIKNGPIVWVKEKSGRMSSLDVEMDKHRGKLSTGSYPVVVLVNGNSASSSEIVSGAIQDSGAGVLVGTRTYGKGLVQTIIPLAGDSAVKITTQHYYTRNKNDINVKRDEEGHTVGGSGGILPNYPVDFTDQQYEALREVTRTDPQNKAAIHKKDPQLQKGIAVLKAKLAARQARRTASAW